MVLFLKHYPTPWRTVPSLETREELADELGFKGDKNDSSTMNIWLYKALMKALADNGGKVPAELLD